MIACRTIVHLKWDYFFSYPSFFRKISVFVFFEVFLLNYVMHPSHVSVVDDTK